MHLYLVRHADPDYERHTLTAQGFQEAAALAVRLESLGVTRVVSSTAPRAILTARAFTDPRGLTLDTHDWLLEPPLQVEQGGRLYALWDTFGERVRAGALPGYDTWSRRPPFDTPDVRAAWQAFCAAADGFLAGLGFRREGERWRVTAPAAGSAPDPARPPAHSRVAVVSHNGTNLLWLAYLLALPLPLVYCGFYTWPSSVTTVYMETHSETWAVPRVLGVADVSHLVAAGIRPSPRGMGPDPYTPWL
jgi:broad specificity phosphatase PhoE